MDKSKAERMDLTSGRLPMRLHWVPRFLSAGVEHYDMRALLQRIERWEDWCREWCAAGAAHEALGDEALAEGRLVSAGQALQRAAAYYHFAGFRFYEDMTQKDDAARRSWAAYRRGAPHFQPAAERIEVPFRDAHLVGYLRLPPGAARAPCVIIIPGMDSRKEEFHFVENQFLARGMATVTYDGPGMGEVWERLKLRWDDEEAVSAIIDFLEDRGEVDTTRVGAYGWAMGGYYAPRAAVRDDRIRACVSMPVRYGLKAWDRLGAMQTDAYCYLFGNVSHDEGRLIAEKFSLEGVLPRLRVPYLIIHGSLGDVVGEEEPRRAAREAGDVANLVIFPEGDHLCINVRYKSWPLMMDWMAAKLGA